MANFWRKKLVIPLDESDIIYEEPLNTEADALWSHVMAALRGLGYDKSEAKTAADYARQTFGDEIELEDAIRAALYATTRGGR